MTQAEALPPSPEAVAAVMWADDNACRSAGMSLVEVGRGRAVVSLTVEAAHVNGLGVCHGGYLFMLADSAMAYASNSENQVALAAAAQIDFLRPAVLGDLLHASATTRSAGKRTSITDVEIRCVGHRAANAEANPDTTQSSPVPTEDAPLIALMRGRTSKTGKQLIDTLPQPST
jgi:acyl-CoA thioesterase